MNADPVAIRLAEPPVVELPIAGTLSVFRFADDGSIVLHKGRDDNAPGEAFLIEAHELTSVWTTLRRIDEGAEVVELGR